MDNRKCDPGRYHNDYSPRYEKPYDIYEKAREQARTVRKETDGKENKRNSEKKEDNKR